jgi:hypothetical protein
MHDENYTPAEQELFDRLPRESALPAGEEDRLVRRLRAEGFFRSRWMPPWTGALATAAALVLGVAIGWYSAGMRSLEAQLTRSHLTAVEAAALVERARGAYVRAHQRYTAATGGDSASPEPFSAESGPQPVRTAGVLWF